MRRFAPYPAVWVLVLTFLLSLSALVITLRILLCAALYSHFAMSRAALSPSLSLCLPPSPIAVAVTDAPLAREPKTKKEAGMTSSADSGAAGSTFDVDATELWGSEPALLVAQLRKGGIAVLDEMGLARGAGDLLLTGTGAGMDAAGGEARAPLAARRARLKALADAYETQYCRLCSAVSCRHCHTDAFVSLLRLSIALLLFSRIQGAFWILPAACRHHPD